MCNERPEQNITKIFFVGMMAIVSHLAAGGPVPAPTQAPQATSTVQISRTPSSLVLPPGGGWDLAFSTCAGCFGEVGIEQIHGMAAATITGPGLPNMDPRASDAGVHSVIRIPLLFAQAGTYQLHLQSRDKHLPVTVTVWLLAMRPKQAGDEERVAAANAFAHAERLRRSMRPGAKQSALASYDQALALAIKLDDVVLERQALTGKARVYIYGTGEYLAGLDAAERAVHLPPAAPDAVSPLSIEDVPAQAHAWKTLSSAYGFLARYQDSIDATDHALKIYTQLGDLYWYGVLQGNLGSEYMEMGETAQALSASESALAIARQLSDSQGIAFGLTTIAAIHEVRGEYQAAFDAYDMALEEMQRTPYPDAEGLVWMGLAGLYDELDDREQERMALERSLPFFLQVHDAANESGALCSLGLLELRQHHLSRARLMMRQSMGIARARGLRREQAQALLGEAEVLGAEGRYARAAKAMDEGLALALQTKEAGTYAELLQARGDLELRQHRPAAAIASYRAAEKEWSSVPSLEHVALARASTANAEWERGDVEQAHQDILLALDGFEASRSRIGGRMLRESFFASRHTYYDLAVAIDMRLGDRPHGRPAVQENYRLQAWETAERARARSLMDAVRGASAFSTGQLSPSLQAAINRTERQIVAAQNMALQVRSTAGSGHGPLQEGQQLHALVEQMDQLEARGHEGGDGKFLDAWKGPPSLKEVQGRVLGPHSVLLEYWMGRRSVYLWAITQKKFQGRRIASAMEMEREIDTYEKLLLAREQYPAGEDFASRNARIARADRQLELQAEVLGRLLLPVALDDSVQRLIIVPDGRIFSVPFAALRTRRYGLFVRRFEVVEEPSAGVALALQERQHGKWGDRLAIFADPIYNQYDPRIAPAHRGPQETAEAARALPASATRDADREFNLAALPRLDGSRAEALAIASVAGDHRTDLFLGPQATPQRVQEMDWKEHWAAHFATHALMDSGHPEMSGIVLSMFQTNGARQDGVLWLNSIYRLHMPLAMVSLSGCRTASGRPIAGEGIAGLAQAFLAAGVSGVVGGLWTVEDQAASELLPAFYQGELQGNLSAPAALRNAQRKLLSDPEHASPYYWAGFIFEGGWQGR